MCKIFLILFVIFCGGGFYLTIALHNIEFLIFVLFSFLFLAIAGLMSQD